MHKRILLAVLGAGLLYGAIALTGEQRPPSPNATPALSVTIVKPRHGSVAETISATGVTIPREEIQVMTELSGVRVREVLVDVGDRVRKGQTLALLDGHSLANQLVQLQSDYERVRDAYERLQAIQHTGAVSQQSVVEHYTAMQAAKASFDNAQLSLTRSTIFAPDDGLVFERHAVIGGLVTDSDPLFRIARRDEIEMEALVPESVLSALRPGQPVSVTLTGEHTPTEGTIRRIAPRVDGATRMAAIRIRLHSTAPVPVGLFATARIVQASREGMLLPRTAIQRDAAGAFVWGLSTDDKAERLPVSVILSGDEQMLVGAIAPGARVVARAGAFTKEGDHLNVVVEN